MRSKNEFTQRQADRIRLLLDAKNQANRSEQKRIRDEIRSIGFYISDFQQSPIGFTREDFNNIIEQGFIKIN